MIIYKPKIVEEKDEICISAKIKLTNSVSDIPQELWYRIPKKYKKYISTRSDSFLIAMIHLAMYLEEDIELKGEVSPKLLNGIEEYQSIYHSWCPNIFRRKVKIKSQKVSKHVGTAKKHVSSSFSGGLDSTYTFYKHIPKYEPFKEYQLESVLFIQSRIFASNQSSMIQAAKKTFKGIVEGHKVEFLNLRTNAGDFERKNVKDWVVLSFGGTLMSSVHIYGNVISKYLIPSSYDYPNLEPCGSHPMTDHLLSTESVQIIHHGADVNKVEKTQFVSTIPQTYSFLRPCWEKPDSKFNCGTCGKCIRTMVSLSLFNKLHKYETYPMNLRRKFIRMAPLNNHNLCYARDNIEYAVKMGRKDVVFDLTYAIYRFKYFQPIIEKMWQMSAFLKKKSRIYERLVREIKNG